MDGRDDATRLSAPLVEQGDVYSFETSPDSSRVLYIADQDVDYLFELYVSFLPVRRTVPAPTVSR